MRLRRWEDDLASDGETEVVRSEQKGHVVWITIDRPERRNALNDQVISVELPVKVDLTVTEAPPGIKGDTATGGTKSVTLETGAKVNVPLFINEGDIIRVNTETGEYVERV